jgi:hypothetical protein
VFVAGFLALAILWLRPRNRVVYGITSGAAFAAVALLHQRHRHALHHPRAPAGQHPVRDLALRDRRELLHRADHRAHQPPPHRALGLHPARVARAVPRQRLRDARQAGHDAEPGGRARHELLARDARDLRHVGLCGGLLAALLANIYIFSKLVGVRRADPRLFRPRRMVYGVVASP